MKVALAIIDVSGKDLKIKYVDGPVGVKAGYFNGDKLKDLGWESKVFLKEGIKKTYEWILEQVNG